MTIKVTPDQVDNARLLIAGHKARGLTTEEWIVRLANAKPAPATPIGEAGGGDGFSTTGLAAGR